VGIENMALAHEMMADEYLVNPTITQQQLAEKFGYSRNWVSEIVDSAVFKAHLARRRAELVEPVLRDEILKFRQLSVGNAVRAAEVVRTKLARPDSEISETFALRVYETHTRSLGLDKKPDEGEEAEPFEERLERLSQHLSAIWDKKRASAMRAEAVDGETTSSHSATQGESSADSRPR
jgi:hypothetical protein